METSQAVSRTFPLVLDGTLEELSARGQAIYDTLREQLEPARDREFIAIHVDSGDYEVGRSTVEAVRALRQRRPADGRTFARKIGMEPEYGLAARILVSDSLGGQK